MHDAAEPLAVSLGISVAHAPEEECTSWHPLGAAAASSPGRWSSSDDLGHNRYVTRHIPFRAFLMYRIL
jgi:hypothetical protein